MQKQESIPTPLIDPGKIKKITIVEENKLSFLQSVRGKGRVFFAISYIFYLHLRAKYSPEEKVPHYRFQKALSIRALLEQMGGLWIKVGQLLSLRADVFSQEFCLELSKLQDSSTGFPFHHVKKIVEENLQSPIERYFDYFEESPLAAASIGQVHLAHLKKEQKMVAIKIQRPNIEYKFKRDMAFVQRGADFLRMISFHPQFNWQELVLELKQIFIEELDYRLEATSMKRMKKTLKPHKIYVPSVYSQYSTQKVMVMEYIDGVQMSDYIKTLQINPTKVDTWLKENNVDPKKVARHLILSFNRQVYEDNLFHGDLHPGNIVLLRNSKIAFIDFGAMGSFEKGFREKILQYNKAIAERNYAKGIDFYFMLVPSLPNIDLNKLKRKLVVVFRNWELRTMTQELSYKERSFNGVTEEITRLIAPYKITVDWLFLRVTRSFSTIDASIIYLHPKINYLKLSRKYHIERGKRVLKEQKKALSSNTVKLREDIQDIPGAISELLSFQVNGAQRGAKVFGMTINKSSVFLGSLSKTVALGLKICFCFLIYSILHKSYKDLPLYDLGWISDFARKLSQQPEDILLLLFVANIYFLNVASVLVKNMTQEDVRKSVH